LPECVKRNLQKDDLVDSGAKRIKTPSAVEFQPRALRGLLRDRGKQPTPGRKGVSDQGLIKATSSLIAQAIVNP